MKALAIAALLVAPAFTSCQNPPPLSPDAQMSVSELDMEQARQRGLAAEARSEGRMEDAQRHEMAANDLDAEAAKIEAQGATEGWGGALRALGSSLPWPLKGAPELILPLIPLAFKRPRKHFLKAVKAVNPWDMTTPPGEAISSILKMYGLKHSSEASEKAAEGEAPTAPS